MFLLVLPQLRSPHDQSTDRKLLSADSPFQCGLKSAKKRYCLLSWESVQPLKMLMMWIPSQYAPMNLLTVFTNVAITAISFNGKYSELTISHGQKQLRPMTLPHWTNQNVFPLLSTTTPPFVPSHPVFTNTFTPLFHPPLFHPPVFKAAPIVALE